MRLLGAAARSGPRLGPKANQSVAGLSRHDAGGEGLHSGDAARRGPQQRCCPSRRPRARAACSAPRPRKTARARRATLLRGGKATAAALLAPTPHPVRSATPSPVAKGGPRGAPRCHQNQAGAQGVRPSQRHPSERGRSHRGSRWASSRYTRVTGARRCAQFRLGIRGIGHLVSRTEDPRVPGSIPVPGTDISYGIAPPPDRKVSRGLLFPASAARASAEATPPFTACGR